MAKRKSVTDESTDETPDVAEPSPLSTDAVGDKLHLIYLEGDPPLGAFHDQPRETPITIGGVTYRHVSDTPEGIWVYRRD